MKNEETITLKFYPPVKIERQMDWSHKDFDFWNVDQADDTAIVIGIKRFRGTFGPVITFSHCSYDGGKEEWISCPVDREWIEARGYSIAT